MFPVVNSSEMGGPGQQIQANAPTPNDWNLQCLSIFDDRHFKSWWLPSGNLAIENGDL
jgi:hypothetical protein